MLLVVVVVAVAVVAVVNRANVGFDGVGDAVVTVGVAAAANNANIVYVVNCVIVVVGVSAVVDDDVVAAVKIEVGRKTDAEYAAPNMPPDLHIAMWVGLGADLGLQG
jgi:hypothetical protein